MSDDTVSIIPFTDCWCFRCCENKYLMENAKNLNDSILKLRQTD